MDSDNEDRYEETPWKGVSGTVLLLNTYDPMKTNSPKQAYNATCDLLRGNMREASSQLIGVCLYGTSKPCGAGVEGLRQIFPLTVTDLDNFLNIQVINLDNIDQTKELKLSDTLWHVNKMFANCKKLLSTKNVVLLTRADVAPVESDQKPTLKRVRDLVDSGVQINIVNISDTKCHIDKFYKTFLAEANKSNVEYPVPEPVWGIGDIVKQMLKHSHRHLAIARLSFEIGPGLSIGVGVYNLLKSNIKPKKVLANKETNQILSRQINYRKKVIDPNDEDADDENGSSMDIPLLQSEMFLYQTLGGERVLFTAEEAKKMRNPFGPPTLKLLGFKPSIVLCKEKWFVHPCYLLYPNDSIIEGSTVAFNALYQACSEMSFVAICMLSTRVNAKPKMVGLSPCTAPLELKDIKAAFDVIPLPFSENVRDIECDEEDVDFTEPQKMFVKSMLEEITFDYKPDLFENPHVQLMTQAIEALALEEESVKPYKDTTLRDASKYQDIDAEVFEEIFEIQHEKRKLGPKPSAVPSKKPKVEKKKVELKDLEELLKTRIKNQEVDKFSTAELVELVKAKGEKKVALMRKTMLCRLVYLHYK